MSKSDLMLKVGTHYDGEGMNKLNNAIKQTANKAKDATGQISKINAALGTMEGKAGQVAGKVSGLFSAFAQGGVVGLAIGAVSAAFSFVSDKIKEAKEKAKEFADTLREKALAAVTSVGNGIDNLTTKFARTVKLMKDSHSLQDVRTETASELDRNGIRERHRNARSGMKNEYDRTYDKAAEQHELTVSDARRQVDSARTNVSRIGEERSSKVKEIESLKAEVEKAKEASKHVTSVQRERDRLQEQLKRVGSYGYQKPVQEMMKQGARQRSDERVAELMADKDNVEKDRKASEEAQKAITDAERKLAKAQEELEDITNRQKEARAKATLQEAKYQGTVAQADQQLKEAKEARDKARQKLIDEMGKGNDEFLKQRDYDSIRDPLVKRMMAEKYQKDQDEKVNGLQDKLFLMSDEGSEDYEEMERINRELLAARKDQLKWDKEVARLTREIEMGDFLKEQASEEERHNEAVKQLHQNMETALKEGVKWEQEARKVRGRSFKEVDREQRQQRKQSDKAARKEVFEVGRAIAELDAIQGKSRFGKGLTKRDRERSEQLQDFIQKQGGGIDEMTPERKAALERLRDNLKGRVLDRNGKLRKGASKADQDQWKALEALFANNNHAKNMAKADEQAMKKLEEEKRVRDIQKAKALSEINERLKQLGV